MNQDSSRSHSIFTITIEVTEKFDAAAAAKAASSGGRVCMCLLMHPFYPACFVSIDAFKQ
jgi:hypothetical protein